MMPIILLPTRRSGYTLIETLTVVGVIGVLVGLLLPAVQSARGSAARASCANRLRQIGTAVHHFHSVYGRLPPASRIQDTRDPDFILSWQVQILPEMDQDPLFAISVAACIADPVAYHVPPHTGYLTVIPSYVCPADDRLLVPLTTPSGDRGAFTSYLAVRGGLKLGIPYPGVITGESPGARLTDVSDGTSQTVMVGERPPPDSLQAGLWYISGYIVEPLGGPTAYSWIPGLKSSPSDTECALAGTQYGPGRLDNPCDRFHFWSLHRGGANWLFADGGVQFLSYNARDVMPALATRAGGEVISMPD